MPRKIPESELLRLACIYAEQDIEGWLDAHSNCTKGYIRIINQRKNLLQQIKAYRLLRWGKTALEARFDTAKSITPEQLSKRKK